MKDKLRSVNEEYVSNDAYSSCLRSIKIMRLSSIK